MNLDEITALAKRASTPDTQYIVEAKLLPGEDPDIIVRRIVELTGLERRYGVGCERTLEEGIERMNREVEALDEKKRRTHPHGAHIGVDRDAIIAYIAEYERMNNGEGPTISEVSRSVGFNQACGSRYHLNKLEEQHRIRMYIDPLNGVKRYKVVKRK